MAAVATGCAAGCGTALPCCTARGGALLRSGESCAAPVALPHADLTFSAGLRKESPPAGGVVERAADAQAAEARLPRLQRILNAYGRPPPRGFSSWCKRLGTFFLHFSSSHRTAAGSRLAAHVLPSVHTLDVLTSFCGPTAVAVGNPAPAPPALLCGAVSCAGGKARLGVLENRKGGVVSARYAAQLEKYGENVVRRSHDDVADAGVAEVADAALPCQWP